jgi:ribosomal protein S27AE
MARETDPNDELSPKGEADFDETGGKRNQTLANEFKDLLRREERECPNCGHPLELMSHQNEDGTVEYEVFYCWNCDHVESLDFDPDDFESEIDEDDAGF